MKGTTICHLQQEVDHTCNVKVIGLNRLMQSAGVKRNRAQQRNSQDVERLESFAAACGRVTFRPPLGVKEAKFLEILQSEKPF